MCVIERVYVRESVCGRANERERVCVCERERGCVCAREHAAWNRNPSVWGGVLISETAFEVAGGRVLPL